MDCTLATLIACFNLSGLYLDGGLQFNDYGTPHMEWSPYVTTVGSGVVETSRYEYIASERENPYGRFAVGYEVGFQNISLRLEASHLSSIRTDNDRGLNAISFSVRWYPFR